MKNQCLCCVWLSHLLHIYKGHIRRSGLKLRSNFKYHTTLLPVCVSARFKLSVAPLTMFDVWSHRQEGWSRVLWCCNLHLSGWTPPRYDDDADAETFTKWPCNYVFTHFKITHCFVILKHRISVGPWLYQYYQMWVVNYLSLYIASLTNLLMYTYWFTVALESSWTFENFSL